MKHLPSYIISVILVAITCGCSLKKGDSPYEGALIAIEVQLSYPQGWESAVHKDVAVKFEEVNFNYVFETRTDDKGFCKAELPCGLYRISASDLQDEAIFNGTTPNVRLFTKTSVSVPLTYSKRGKLVIKEIYCGGCQKFPVTGNYQSDKYIIIHNNDTQTAYLDSLCFCTLCPYNATSSNPWGSIQDFAPVIQALWQFGGDGHSFPLESGGDAVLCLNGAIDHTVQYPLSVNLNNSEYFVCYNNVYFTNLTYHPAPGDKIRNDHILNVVTKLGKANAYAFSQNSPTVLIFKAKGCTIQDFVKQEGKIIQVPGSTSDNVLKVPWDWIMDAVEVFTPSGSCNKRLPDDMDSGYVVLTESGMGHSLVRLKDEETSAKNGYEVLKDTNNSSVDFVQSEKATLYRSNE